MIREPLRVASHQNHAVRCHIPLEWEPPDDNMAHSPCFSNSVSSILDSFAALHRYLPSNIHAAEEEQTLDSFSCDEFRMYEFKVKKCARARSHDWTECPYAHPGEKARRRDPRRYLYSGIACHEFRKGTGCKKGDSCEFGHGVFECWLHPARYRTQPCKDGTSCRRRVCFFAHTPDQLRVLPYDFEHRSFVTSSPPLSPSAESPMSPGSPEEMLDLMGAMRGIQLGKMRIGVGPRAYFCSTMRTCGPKTPTRSPSSTCSHGLSEIWDMAMLQEGQMMERVESGRDIRAQMYAKLSRENSLGREKEEPSFVAPDLGWVSDLVE